MIVVEDLCVTLGGREILDHISFTVPPGQVTGFLGPNGAGKSTTMKAVLGLIPSSGEATIAGTKYSDMDQPLSHVGAILDDAQPHGDHTARRHLRWVAATHSISRRRIDDVLGLVGLTDEADRKVKGYSLGMRQRLGLAGGLLGDPNVLLLDEPMNGLDPEGIRWMRLFLKQLAQEGKTVLVSSHLLNEMSLVADRLVMIDRGKILGEHPTDVLLDRFTPKSQAGRHQADATTLEEIFLEMINDARQES